MPFIVSFSSAPDETSAPFFDGAREGRLMLQTCRGCAVWLHPVRGRCPECGGTDIGWEQASGRGTVWGYTIMVQPYVPGYRDEMPYNVVLVELEEGPMVYSNLVDVPDDEVRPDLPVEAFFDDVTDEFTLIRFHRRSS